MRRSRTGNTFAFIVAWRWRSAGSSCSLAARVAETLRVVGITSFDDYQTTNKIDHFIFVNKRKYSYNSLKENTCDIFTWSFWCTARPSLELASRARTSFMFIFVLVALPSEASQHAQHKTTPTYWYSATTLHPTCLKNRKWEMGQQSIIGHRAQIGYRIINGNHHVRFHQP